MAEVSVNDHSLYSQFEEEDSDNYCEKSSDDGSASNSDDEPEIQDSENDGNPSDSDAEPQLEDSEPDQLGTQNRVHNEVVFRRS